MQKTKSQIGILMNKFINVIAWITLLSCKHESTNCIYKYDIQIHNCIIENFDSIYTLSEEDSIIKYEKSIGSIIVFYNHSNDNELFDFHKDSLLNPKDRYVDGSTMLNNICIHCFLGERINTRIVSLRTQNHPYIKEVAVYGMGDYGNEWSSRTYFYYRNRVLDQLIPENLLAQYKKDTFSIYEFWCYRDQLLNALDHYHGIDSTFEKPNKKQRLILERNINYINECLKENFTGTDDDYTWLKENNEKMITYEWVTSNHMPFKNRLEVNTFWYNSNINKYINAGRISSPKDIYMELRLTYRKDYVDQIIYK